MPVIARRFLLLILWIAIVSPVLPCASAEDESEPVRQSTRSRRVLYNFDGDSCLSTKADSKGPVPVNIDDVKRLIEEVAYEGSRVDTVLVCINAQVMYYPTKVGTMRGTLSTPEERANWSESEKQRFKNLKAFFDAGVDPYAVMLAEAKQRGCEALLTFRMNDDHGTDFLTTQFLVDHADWRLGTKQYQGSGAMDFARDEVRDYTFRLIEEAVGRYDCDGIELDFNRFPRFFKDGSTDERVAKMNSLVERVRKMLDETGHRRGRRLVLSVRPPSNFGSTPPTPETARELGCDVPAWVKNGWVDFVAVSEFLFERGDLPIDKWKQAITTVPVYGGIECTKGGGAKNLNADEYRHAATQLIKAGADGVYLFNFFTSREGGKAAYEPPFEVLAELVVANVAEPEQFVVEKLGVSFQQKDPTQAVYEFVNYSSNHGPNMFRVRFEELKDDIFSNFELAVSADHGRTWTDTEKWKSVKRRPDGQERRLFIYGSFFDPQNGRLLFMGNEGVLRNDHPLDGQTNNYPIYRVSKDGGRTWLFEERVIQTGEGFTREHPFDGVRIGSNSLTVSNALAHRSDGAVLVPVQVSHVGPDGRLYRPPGAYTYLDAAVLIGTWRDDGRLDWQLSKRLNLPPDKSLRGIFEPTLAEFPDGRLLMVCRSNSGRKWFSVSSDGGLTWATPDVWRYSDGTLFYSPSSISRLIRHSSGEYCWIGNISPDHPRGNAPRYPLVIGRVDPKSLRLIRESVTTIDTRGPDDVAGLQLSNFCVHEDRRTQHFHVRVTRWDGRASGRGPVDGSVYAFQVELSKSYDRAEP